MKKKIFIIIAILFADLSASTAQVVIKDGNNKVEVKGKEVKISSGSAPVQQTAGNITITGAGDKRETYDGNGKDISIQGSNHYLRITGYPNRITVSGSNNAVYTDGAKSISVSGHNNTVVKGTL